MQRVEEILAAGHRSRDIIYLQNLALYNVISLINSGHFSHGKNLFCSDRWSTVCSRVILSLYVQISKTILINCQNQVSQTSKNQNQWTRICILNMARCGRFSSDRAIREYNEETWHFPPMSVKLTQGMRMNLISDQQNHYSKSQSANGRQVWTTCFEGQQRVCV